MNKLIISLCFIVTISLYSCEKREKSSPQPQKESQKLDNTENEHNNVQNSKKSDEASVDNSKVLNASINKTSETPKPGNEVVRTENLWNIYRKCKTGAEKAKEHGDYKKSIELTLQGADAAIKLKRPDIAAWQYNNAAKHAIDYYIAETKFQERMRKAAEIKDSEKKSALKKETKSIMNSNLSILEEAETYLSSAKKYDEVKSDPKRVSAIKSNMNFIKEMRSIIE